MCLWNCISVYSVRLGLFHVTKLKFARALADSRQICEHQFEELLAMAQVRNHPGTVAHFHETTFHPVDGIHLLAVARRHDQVAGA